MSSPHNAKHISFKPLPEKEAAWTRLKRATYLDPTGKKRDWEYAERTTRPAGSDIDGVGIVAILEKESGPEIMLQKQYRPPVKAVCIEIPAGLIDAGETVEQAAIRELREETGYVGKVRNSSPVMFCDPGFCNTNLRTVHMTVDLSLSENQNPKPQLEEEEFIEVFFVPLKILFNELKKLEGEGYAIDARIGSLAEGIEVAKTFGLKW